MPKYVNNCKYLETGNLEYFMLRKIQLEIFEYDKVIYFLLLLSLQKRKDKGDTKDTKYTQKIGNNINYRSCERTCWLWFALCSRIFTIYLEKA